MTTVVNIHKTPVAMYSKDYVYIGRPTIFGNPFDVKTHGRKKCLVMFEEYFKHKIANVSSFKSAVHELKGKTLGCFCKPAGCHGDIIKRYLDEL
jgi:hypothetical protein